VLKVGLAWPLPERLFREFAAGISRVVVVEELDPHLETHVKALGIRAQGKELIPIVGELDPRIVRQAITGEAIPCAPPNRFPPARRTYAPGAPTGGSSSR